MAYETIQEEETAVEKARRKKEDKDKYHVEEQALYKIVTARHKLSASQKFFAEEEEKRNKKVERNKYADPSYKHIFRGVDRWGGGCGDVGMWHGLVYSVTYVHMICVHEHLCVVWWCG